MRVALDTNRLTDLLRGDQELANLLGTCDEVHIPLPVLAELIAGFLGGSRRLENEALLNEFLAQPTVRLLLPTAETANEYARLFVELKTAGTPVPINDLWIAALALQHRLTLVTRDAHFGRFPQLVRRER